MRKSFVRISEETYLDFVRRLYDTALLTIVMAAAFVASAALLYARTGDRWLYVFGIIGAITAALRLGIVAAGRHMLASAALTRAAARRLERWFATGYLAFAVALALFCWRGFVVGGTAAHALLVGLLFGYAAGAAFSVSFRPWISITASIVAVTPSMLFNLLSSEPLDRAVGCLFALFLAAGVESMVARFRTAADGISMKHLFASLARKDGLTGLANRLALAERFQEIATNVGSGTAVAVHCVDLDGFKPVNDRYGHPVGDQLLQAVAVRLRQMLRATDFVARTGGDEFIVVQPNVTDASEPELLARRIARLLAAPYVIGEQEIVIGASVGYALCDERYCRLEALIDAADDALLKAKDRRGSIVQGTLRGAGGTHG